MLYFNHEVVLHIYHLCIMKDAFTIDSFEKEMAFIISKLLLCKKSELMSEKQTTENG